MNKEGHAPLPEIIDSAEDAKRIMDNHTNNINYPSTEIIEVRVPNRKERERLILILVKNGYIVWQKLLKENVIDIDNKMEYRAIHYVCFYYRVEKNDPEK